MIQSIVDGISVRLNEYFGEKYKIYTETVRQGLKEPCFFVSLLSPAYGRDTGRRFLKSNFFCIQYFPASKEEPKSECYKIQDGLFLALEYINVCGELKRGTKMRGELADGILNFFVNFDMFVVTHEEQTPMGELQTPEIIMKGDYNGKKR